MAQVTLELGPVWKMEFLRDVLAEHGVPSFVADSTIKTIDPLLTGALSFDARLEVAEEVLADARAALAEAHAEGAALRSATDESSEAEEPREPELDRLAELGRRIQWSLVYFWTQPFAFVLGWKYLAGLAHVRARPRGHAFTMLALAGVTVVWCSVIALLLNAAR